MATEIFRIEGLAELEAKLADLMALGKADLVARQTLVKAAKDAMEPVYQEVATTAPVGPGIPIHLKDTVRLEARIPNQSDRKSTLVQQSDVAIAVVSVKKSAVSLANEFGTSKMAAQPFLRKALASNVDQVVMNFKNDLEDYIRAVANKKRRKK